MAYKDKATDTSYTVMGGFRKHRDHFRVMSCHNGHLRVVKGFPWRESAEEALAELDSPAKANGWRPGDMKVTRSIWIPIPYGPNLGEWGVCRRVYYDRRGIRLKAQYYYKGKVYYGYQKAQKVADKLNLKEWEKKKG